eukprot:2443806-Amphidinium_carterae.1
MATFAKIHEIPLPSSESTPGWKRSMRESLFAKDFYVLGWTNHVGKTVWGGVLRSGRGHQSVR